LAIDTKNAQIYNDLSLVYFKKGAFPRALESIENAITLDPRLFEAYYNRAIVFETMKEKEKAIAAWKTYLELGVDDHFDWRWEALSNINELSK